MINKNWIFLSYRNCKPPYPELLFLSMLPSQNTNERIDTPCSAAEATSRSPKVRREGKKSLETERQQHRAWLHFSSCTGSPLVSGLRSSSRWLRTPSDHRACHHHPHWLRSPTPIRCSSWLSLMWVGLKVTLSKRQETLQSGGLGLTLSSVTVRAASYV